ncbi:hypothetical protein [Nakamurella sp. PAMC28650]|uniref:hypothetical protein n=1 Tax=Nakamurella sp. PAMC28650 TaxID=2762325 RepID=UPI00351B2624
MIYTEAQGRGGIRYEYFLCRGRQDGLCDLPHLPAAQVEDAITRHYATLGLPANFVAVVRGELEATMADQQSTVKELHSQLKTQLARLDVQEERLLDLAAEGDLPKEKIKARLRKIQQERASAERGLDETAEQLAVGAQILTTYLELLEQPQKLYERSPDESRRTLNSAFYEEIFLEDHGVQFDVKTPPIREFHDAVPAFHIRQANDSSRHYRTSGASRQTWAKTGGMDGDVKRGPVVADKASLSTWTYSLADHFQVGGSSKHVLVGMTGFEPATP